MTIPEVLDRIADRVLAHKLIHRTQYDKTKQALLGAETRYLRDPSDQRANELKAARKRFQAARRSGV